MLKLFKNESKYSSSNSIYLSELRVPSINTNGPNLLLQKHPQTIIPIEFFTVGFKQSTLYRSSFLRQTQLLESLLKSSYRDSSLQIIFSHSVIQFFRMRHHPYLFFRFFSEIKGFSLQHDHYTLFHVRFFVLFF